VNFQHFLDEPVLA